MDKLDKLEDERLKDQLPPVTEDTGVNTRAIFKFCVGLVVTALFVNVLIWVVFNFLDDRKKAEDIEISPVAPPVNQVPQGPRLQATPNLTNPDNKQIFEGLDIINNQDAERLTLNSYGWVDEKNGIVRIPIDRAIDLFIEQQKLPQEPPVVLQPKQENEQQ